MFAIFLTEGMDPFYQNIASFPTVFFSFFLILTLFYWLAAVLGLVDIDVFDLDLPETDGIADIDSSSGSSGPDALAGLMLKFGLHGVPVTIIISFISLFGWLISYYLVHFLMPFEPGHLLRYVLGLVVLLAALYISVMITAQVIKPLRKLFKSVNRHTTKEVLGQTVIVRTSRVDDNFGEAVLEDGGAGLILKVRSRNDQIFCKGDQVVLLEYEKEKNIYFVISLQEFTGISEN